MDKDGLLIPYYMKGKNQPTRYNDRTVILPQKDDDVTTTESDFDPFKVASQSDKVGSVG